MADKAGAKAHMRHRLSALVMLVVLMAFILFVSMAISGAVAYALFEVNLIDSAPERRHLVLILYMLSVNLVMGTFLARIVGKRFLRQFYDLFDAMREVAAGNFEVRMKAGPARETVSLADNFNEMVRELSAMETLRADFVKDVSHEFRTPVTSILGFARRLKGDSLTKERRDEYADIIIAEGERLTRLSDNVLLLSNLEGAGKASERRPYPLDEQIRRTILLMQPLFQRKGLGMDIELAPVAVCANEELMSHVWINLLGNAVKFSPDGGTVEVTLEGREGGASVRVSDHGIGMDGDVVRRAFEKFYKGDGSRATEGNGLGLSLVKRILDLEGGGIEVESEPGKGTRVTVTMPSA
ncbi:MAG: HAMP domain-containing histidine kinase [Oscillospiraceae bacterium]|nr:HAMP domain-containing histidine kinase [Oscillospiraceae bacterium]